MTLTEKFESFNEKIDAPKVGEVVVERETFAYDEEGRLFTRKFVNVGDESDTYPEQREAFAQEADAYDAFLVEHPEIPGTQIVIDQATGVKYVDLPGENLAARWLYLDSEGYRTQMMDWAKDFPTAIALESLQRLSTGGRRLPQGELDDRTRNLFTYMVDAIGIRSRAHIYAERLVEIAQEKDGPLDIISVGCGAAVPNIEATQRIEQEADSFVQWKFYDIDTNALGFSHELIEEADFQKSSVDYGPVAYNTQTNSWDMQGRSFVRAYKEPSESVDVVDALGLWEYLEDKTATKFLQRLYDKVRPGGTMIVSNMLEGRPQQEFNQRGVGWPMLQLRSETDLLRIVESAGIPTENVTMTHAKDGVYVVMDIKK